MNAYELADEIERPMLTKPDFLHFGRTKESMQEIVNMLRQQADRIAELEKEVKELHKIAQVMAMQESDARKSLQNYKDGIK